MLGKNLQKIILRNFSGATKAKIKFLGKRSLLPQDHSHNLLSTKETENHNINTNIQKESKSFKNSLSSFTLNSYRIKVSDEETDIINNGGSWNLPDWNKIKLKPKIKKL